MVNILMWLDRECTLLKSRFKFADFCRKLLAEAALQNLDFSTAEMAFVRQNDYAGVQLIKKLATVQSTQLKKAMIACALKNYDEAEALYVKCDRR